ncbi:serpin 1 [Danaus plexippus plexippus]|uniref:Serpin 1 n=1 Tax=Danaus plexippus plexippus TaxID=278856 RepID=A0A212FD30_DANPL|nr:serpin 1 [Danaus plexippus plexippus]
MVVTGKGNRLPRCVVDVTVSSPDLLGKVGEKRVTGKATLSKGGKDEPDNIKKEYSAIVVEVCEEVLLKQGVGTNLQLLGYQRTGGNKRRNYSPSNHRIYCAADCRKVMEDNLNKKHIFFFAITAMASEKTLNEMLFNSNTQFTTKMFKEVVKAKPGQSVVLSAFSVLPPLAHLALASVGESHDELLDVIEMPNDNVTKAVFSKANTVLRLVKGVTLKMASKVYVAENYALNRDFAALSQDVFGSEVENIDFSENENASKKINQWVEDETNNRIKDLVDPTSLDADTKAGAWKTPFDKKSTTDRDFHVSKENVVKVPTMYNSDTFYYIDSEELDAQVLELKYEGEDSALYVVLPHDVDGINKLKEKLRDPSIFFNLI